MHFADSFSHPTEPAFCSAITAVTIVPGLIVWQTTHTPGLRPLSCKSLEYSLYYTYLLIYIYDTSCATIVSIYIYLDIYIYLYIYSFCLSYFGH